MFWQNALSATGNIKIRKKAALPSDHVRLLLPISAFQELFPFPFEAI